MDHDEAKVTRLYEGLPEISGPNLARVVALDLAIKALPDAGPHSQVERAYIYYDFLRAAWV